MADFYADYDVSAASTADTAPVAAGSGWEGWSSALQGAFTYGVGRLIDSETRQNNPYNTYPGTYPGQVVPIATTGATTVDNKMLLIGGALLLAVVAFVALRD